VLQDDDGQVIEAHSISAGLDYPGVGPELSFLRDSGRLTLAQVRDDEALDAAFHLCGPAPFLAALTAALRDAGVPEDRIRSERFASVQERGLSPFLHAAVSFNRSGVQATWEQGSLLDLAEAHGVQPESGCRVGACHACATAVLDGEVDHDPAPLAPPPDGTALLCCARPRGDVVLDA